MPSPDSDDTEIQRTTAKPVSHQSFKRRTPAKRSNVPQSSPSTRSAPPPHTRRRLDTGNQNISGIENEASHSILIPLIILDPSAIIKELIEIALDAGATRINVRVRGKGALDSITVSDNGHGIPARDYDSLCLPSTTSKRSSFGDLEKFGTFGFRGDALSAICAIAKSTTVTTRTTDDTLATVLKYAKDGSLASQNIAARPVGTTVQVESVFHALPVRRKGAVKGHNRQVSRCVEVAQALALISVNARIELKIGGEIKVGNRPTMKEPEVMPSSLGKVCLSALRHNAESVLGARVSESLIEVASDKAATVEIPPNAQAAMRTDGMTESENLDTMTAYGCHGLVSRASLGTVGSRGRAKSSYQYIFVNRRPVDFPRLTCTIKEVFRRATGLHAVAPVILLNLVLPTWSCDVNLAPDTDKPVVCVHEEDKLIAGIVSLLEGIWIPTKTDTIPVQKDPNLTYMIQSSPKVDVPDNTPSQPTVDLDMVDIPHERDVDDFAYMPNSNVSHQDPTSPNDDGVSDLVEREGRQVPSSDHVTANLQCAELPTQSGTTSEAKEDSSHPSEVEPAVTPSDAELSLSSVRTVREQSTSDKAGPSARRVPCQRRARDSLIHASARPSTTRDVSSFIARRSKSLAPEKRLPPAKFMWPATNVDSEEEQLEGEQDELTSPENEKQESDVRDAQPEIVIDKPRPETDYPRSVGVLYVDWDAVLEAMCEGDDMYDYSAENQREVEGQTCEDVSMGDVESENGNDSLSERIVIAPYRRLASIA